MASLQPALRQHREPHIQPASERCPVCDQPIPNEKAQETRARMKALTEAANARAAQQLAAEKERIEAAAKAAIDELRKESTEALKKAAGDAAAKAGAARAEGQQAAEASLRETIAIAERAKLDAEAAAARKVAEIEQAASARDVTWQEKFAATDTERQEALTQLQALKAEQDALVGKRVGEAREALEKEKAEALAAAERAKANAEAVSQERIAALEQAAKVRDADWQEKVAAVEQAKQQAIDQYEAFKATQEQIVTERVQEVREAMQRDKDDALGVEKAKHFEETQKLMGKLETLTRQLDKKTAEELGEGAEINLFEALRAEFHGDRLERVRKGVSGADIIHTVVHNGRVCGRIIYDSKNSTVWRNDYVSKLVQDQTAAKADQAILSTFKLPDGARQVEVRGTVIIVNPARVLALVRIIRRHIVQVDTLRLSKLDRAKKMAALYDFITSERCSHLLSRIESHSEALLGLQEKEITAHQAHWKHEGQLLRSIQKVKAELEAEIDVIIGTDDAAE